MRKYKARVISGKGRGKQIGFPTLNLEVPPNFNYNYGIYGGLVVIDDKKYKGAFHYGSIPSFGNEEISLEVFVIDTDIKKPPGDITFELGKYIRGIKKFESAEELTQQINKDIETIG